MEGGEDCHGRVGESKAPSIVIHGTADAAIDIELAERLCSGLANSVPLVTIEGGGHACNLTHPKLVNPVVQKFLADLGLPIPRAGDRRGRRGRAGARSTLLWRTGPILPR